LNDEAEKLLQYRDEVSVELARRMERVRKLEQDIASQAFLLEAADRGRRVLTGDTTRALVQASYRARLKREIVRLERERAEAVEDVARAEQRLRQVDSEIEELEGIEEGDETDVSAQEGD
jgi:TolA-binding protein